MQMRRQRTPLRPVLGQRVHVQRGFGVAVQVEDDIGSTGMAEQYPLHALQLAARLGQCIERIGHCLADHAHIGVGIIAQAAFEQPCNRLAQLNEIAVEVLARAHLETPLVRALQQLAQAHRVGHRHQLDHPVEGTLLLQFGQAFFSSQAARIPGNLSACRLAWIYALRSP